MIPDQCSNSPKEQFNLLVIYRSYLVLENFFGGEGVQKVRHSYTSQKSPWGIVFLKQLQNKCYKIELSRKSVPFGLFLCLECKLSVCAMLFLCVQRYLCPCSAFFGVVIYEVILWLILCVRFLRTQDLLISGHTGYICKTRYLQQDFYWLYQKLYITKCSN